MLAECSWAYCGPGSNPSCRNARVKVVVASLISDHVVPDRFSRRAQSTPTCSAVFCTSGSSGSPKCSTSALMSAACSLSTALPEGTRAWNITDGRPRPRLCSRSVATAFISQSSSKCPRTVLTCMPRVSAISDALAPSSKLRSVSSTSRCMRDSGMVSVASLAVGGGRFSVSGTSLSVLTSDLRFSLAFRRFVYAFELSAGAG